MTKIDVLRRYLLPCITPPTGASASNGVSKKRLSTSLRDDIDVQDSASSSEVTSFAAADNSDYLSPVTQPQRPSKTMVIYWYDFREEKGTRVVLCVQHDRLSLKPLHCDEPASPRDELGSLLNGPTRVEVLPAEIRTGLDHVLLTRRRG